jgi:hypothetical protein
MVRGTDLPHILHPLSELLSDIDFIHRLSPSFEELATEYTEIH